MKKKIVFIIGFLITTLVFSGCLQKGTGTLILQITDDPSLNITQALVTIAHIRTHHIAPGENESNENTSGWTTVTNEIYTVDLVHLKNVTTLLASIELTAGWYTQIRLDVTHAEIVIDNITYNLTIPSKTIKLITPFMINSNQTTTLTLDFDLEKSVHKTGNNKYLFKPTIKVTQE